MTAVKEFLNEMIHSFFDFTPAGIMSLVCLISMITASLVKGKSMKIILMLVFCGNFSIAVSYLLAGEGINGAASCFIGAAQSVINYFFDSKGKPLPKWLIGIYMAAFVVVNLVVSFSTGFNPLCLLAIVASLTFVMMIDQDNGAKYRFWVICNSVLWCIYDILSKSPSNFATHVCLLTFTLVGMIIHDRKKKSEVKE